MNRAQRRAQAKRQRSGKARKVAVSSGALLGIGASLIPITPAAAVAGPYEVTDASDVGGGAGLTLREAIDAANGNPGVDTITFADDVSLIQLTEGAIGITDGLYINGPGAGALTVDGQNLSRIFYSGTGELGAPADVTIEGISLVNGEADLDDATDDTTDDAVDDHGGAIDMAGGSLTLRNVRIAGSHADTGGAISVDGGGLAITGSTIEDNKADRNGGGIWASAVTGDVAITDTTIGGNAVGDYDYDPGCDGLGTYGDPGYCGAYVAPSMSFEGYDGGGIFFSSVEANLTLTDSTVTQNTAPRDGGGIHFDSVDGEGGALTSGDLRVIGGSIDNNDAGSFAGPTAGRPLAGNGGGVWFSSPTGDLNFSSGAVTSNTAITTTFKYGAQGGGAEIVSGTATISGTSFAQNSAKYGGGLESSGGDVTITGSTFSENHANQDGGALAFDSSGGPVLALAPATPGAISIASSSLTGNTASRDGGAVSIGRLYAALEISDGTMIDENQASNSGGGVFVDSVDTADGVSGGSVSITGSSISGNTATSGAGGGIDIEYLYAPLSISRSTIDDNTAYDGGGGVYIDYNDDTPSFGSIEISESSISGNEVLDGGGGGLYVNELYSSLTITNSTIDDNRAYDGGGIYLDEIDGDASVTISGSSISGDTTFGDEGEGGGIYINELYAPLEIRDSTINDNTAYDGGGLYIEETDEYGTTTIDSTTISGNTASGGGGGIWADELYGGLTLTDSTIADNSAAYYGGGLYFGGEGSDAPVVVERTTISGNHADGGGGGVSFWDEGTQTLLFVNSTISGNSAGEDGGGIATTGGAGDLVGSPSLENLPEGPVFVFTTVTGNTAAGDGGGIYLYGGEGSTPNAYLLNSVVANSVSSADLAGSGTFDVSYSLIEDPGTASINDIGGEGASSIFGEDPELGPLADNGGETLTHAPLLTSPVVDAGDPGFVAPPSTDQRLVARRQGLRVDMGSVEVVPSGGGGGFPPPAQGDATVQFSPGGVTVNEDGGSATVTVVRSGSTSGISTVDYATSNGTNVSAADYTATAGTLTFGPGETSAQFTVPIVDDNLDEPDEVVVVSLSNPTPGGTTLGAQSTGTVTIIDDDGNAACPDPARSGFGDVAGTNVHSAAIDCLFELGITKGTTGTTFSPSQDVTRGQMASFIARVIEEAGASLASSPADAFADDNGTFHEADINRLAAAGIVQGFEDGTYREGLKVTRGQMATYLANAYAYITGEELTATSDHFADDDGTTHEGDINKIAEADIAHGFTDGTYRPGVNVRRDQMASFLLNLLLAVEG